MKLPKSYYNPISFFGSLIAGFSTLLIVFLFLITTFMSAGGSYIGLIIYMVLPVFLILGLLMIPLGMVRKIRREKKTGTTEGRWNIINMNDARTRNAMISFVIVTFLFLFLSAIGSYQAFHYTESNEFCGTLCHSVMEPEYVAYQQSPHAHVKCVECHVGEGADWYVRSKLSGMYQIYSVLAKKYPKPIPTPIHNLRPARETCEKCHWPNKFYSYRIKNIKSYLADSANTAWNVALKMKTSGRLNTDGLAEGIHYHINPDVTIEYISRTESRESIPWVSYTNAATGKTIIYQDAMDPLDTNAIDSIPRREMDCMDCHNRPSHLYHAPTDYVDDGFNKGIIPVGLPYIKQIAMQVLQERFATKDSTFTFIESEVKAFYQAEYPEIAENQSDLIDKAIEGIKQEFALNSFPRMKVYHDAYTSHIGHQTSKGCFRCHSGSHESETGETISNDCNLCHTIIAQGSDSTLQAVTIYEQLDFKHPEDIDEMWREMHCSDCHSELY